MTVLLIILYVIVCIFLILVVLLQQGKGADLAGAFGGGGSQTSFGPRTGSNIMHRLTTVSFVLFVLLSMTLAILSGKARTSVMEDVDPAVPTEASEPVVDSSQERDPAAALAKGEETAPAGEEGSAEGVPAEAEDDSASEQNTAAEEVPQAPN